MPHNNVLNRFVKNMCIDSVMHTSHTFPFFLNELLYFYCKMWSEFEYLEMLLQKELEN